MKNPRTPWPEPLRGLRYRVDFTLDDKPDAISVVLISDTDDARTRAKDRARMISRRKGVSTAYAIASRDGVDIGQRVYVRGAFSYQDDKY